jgi:hypothetical protein
VISSTFCAFTTLGMIVPISGAVLVRGCAAFEETYWISVFDRLLDGSQECLVAPFHHRSWIRPITTDRRSTMPAGCPPASSMNWPSIDGTYVELAVCVVNRHKVAILDAKHTA